MVSGTEFFLHVYFFGSKYKCLFMKNNCERAGRSRPPHRYTAPPRPAPSAARSPSRCPPMPGSAPTTANWLYGPSKYIIYSILNIHTLYTRYRVEAEGTVKQLSWPAFLISSFPVRKPFYYTKANILLFLKPPKTPIPLQ
jgi:hypothetical protein